MARGSDRGPMPSNIDEMESNPSVGGPMPQPPQSWLSRPTGDSQSSSQNLPSGNQSDQIQSEETGPSSNQSETRRTRGATYMPGGWGDNGGIMHIETNEFGQPIMKESSKLASHLGVLARSGNLAPLSYYFWTDVPNFYKDLIWDHITANTDANDGMKKILMQSVGKKWREWKCDVKRKYYLLYNTDAERLEHCPKRVEADQWRALVYYWGTDKAKKKSETNKVSRAYQVTPHTTGRTSFARVKELLKEQDGIPPSRRKVYTKCYTKKDGTAVNHATAEIIGKMNDIVSQHPDALDSDYGQDDILSQVMGPDKPGRVRTFGLGPTPTQVFGSEYRKSQSEKIDYDNKLKEEIKRLELEMESKMEERVEERVQATVKSQLAEFQAELVAKFQAMGYSIPQENGPSDPLGTKQVPDASRTHQVRSHVLHSGEQRNLQLTAPREKRKHDLLNSSSSQNIMSNERLKEIHLLSITIPKYTVAKGLIVSKDPSKVVNGVKLGADFWEIHITNVRNASEELIRPCGLVKTLGDAIKMSIAWPSVNVVEEL